MLITGAAWVIGSSWMLKPGKRKGLRKRGTGQSRVQSERDHILFQKQIPCSQIEFQSLRLRLGIILSHIWFVRKENFPLQSTSHFQFFLKKIFVLDSSFIPCVFPSSSDKWAGTLRPTVRCAVTRADREWCPEGCWRIVPETWKHPAAWADFDHCVPVIFKQ